MVLLSEDRKPAMESVPTFFVALDVVEVHAVPETVADISDEVASGAGEGFFAQEEARHNHDNTMDARDIYFLPILIF